MAGANATTMLNEVHSHPNRIGGAVGRGVSGPDPVANAFMRPRNGPTGDGSDVVFDMKSFSHTRAVAALLTVQSNSFDFYSPTIGRINPTLVRW